MSEKMVLVTFPKCGTCEYAQNFKQDIADCHGMPPSVHVIGVQPDALGRPQIHIETFVPKVKAERPACSLHRPKQDFATAGRS